MSLNRLTCVALSIKRWLGNPNNILPNCPDITTLLQRGRGNCFCTMAKLLYSNQLHQPFFLSFSYLDLLGTFRKLVSLKKSEIVNARIRTKTGLDKVSLYICLAFQETPMIILNKFSIFN